MTSTLWRGQFGDAYVQRNPSDAAHIAARARLWGTILSHMDGLRSILEVGASVGNNLRALATITNARLFAVEPHAGARAILTRDHVVALPVFDGTADAIPISDGSKDLVFTSGVLIHVHPDDLAQSCREIHRVSRRYIVSIEYFSADPATVTYRGHDALWKRDFGAFWLEQFPTLKPIACGFAWKPLTGLDNLTYWIFEK